MDNKKEDVLILRNEIINDYRRWTPQLTQQEKAYELTSHAISCGYIESRPKIFGQTLGNYIRQRRHKKIHWWVLKSVLDLLLDLGWKPRTDRSWTSFVLCWMFKNGPFMNVEKALESLPDDFDRTVAEQFFVKFQHRLEISEKTKPVCWFENDVGERVSKVYLSSKRLCDAFFREHGYETIEQANENGFRMSSQHVLKDNLMSYEGLDFEELQRIYESAQPYLL